MADLYDTILQAVKDRCPNINWRLGGLLRELLVEPINAMQNSVQAYISEALSNLDLTTALSSPAEYEATLNVWMKRLHIASPTSRKSTGEIALLLEPTSDSLTIPQRTKFECGDVQLVTESSYTFAPSQFTQISAECWSCTVPVSSATASCLNVAAGSPVTWSSAPSIISDMFVSTAITGGSTELTAQEKANLITAELDSGAISGEQAISTALRKRFQGSVVSALLGSYNVVKMPLYVKFKQIPTTSTGSFQVVHDKNTGSNYVNIPATGLVKVLSINDGSESLNFTIVESYDDYVKAEINKDKLNTDSVSVTYMLFTELPKVSAWLNAAQRALPYRFDCKTPVVANLKLFVNTGGLDIDLSTRSKVQEYICDKPLNSDIRDSEIIAILKSNRYNVNGSILYSVSIATPTYSNVWSSSGSVSPAGQISLEGVPVAFYSTVADIVGC